MIRWLVLAALVSSSNCSRPRGIRAEVASLYNPGSDFRCFDGSNTIPFIQVNDDYCDCEDGSDEPGTSACPNGKFFCENAGHKAMVIPSGRVGDGLCDCCDGTDEWETGAACENTCSELGRAAREAKQAELKAALEGFNIRRGMVEEAKRIREEKVADLASKEAVLIQQESVKELKEKEKEAAEGPEKEALEFYRKVEDEERRKKEESEAAARDAEAGEYFAILDSDADGVITIEELRARSGLDTNKDGEVSEEEAKFFLSDQEHFTHETFKTTGFVLLKPYLDLEKGQPEPEEATKEEIESVGEEEGTTPEVDWHPMMTPEPPAADPNAPDHPMMTPAPPTFDEDEDYPDEDDDKEEDEEDYDINDHDDEDLSAPSEEKKEEEQKYDEATQALITAAETARKAFNDADREFRDTEREIRNLKDVLEKDFGEEHEFSVLNGQCFEYTDNEYKYKMCPFDHCSQKPKHGGSETRLGSWGSWEGLSTGAGTMKYSVMKFTGGQGCWNGPARSTTVHLHCGTENIVTAVSEPNKCEYEMHFTTPAICRHPGASHDEL